jgi:hypothetical protein
MELCKLPHDLVDALASNEDDKDDEYAHKEDVGKTHYSLFFQMRCHLNSTFKWRDLSGPARSFR